MNALIYQPLAEETGGIAALGRVFLAIVLGVAAWTKLRDRGGFRAVLRFLVPQAPAPTITSLAAAVVGFEALLAGLLVAGFRTDVVAWGTVGFLCVGTAALLMLRRRGYQGGCACFGDHATAGPPGSLDLVRNAALIAVSFAISQASAAARPLWAFPAATIALLVATTVGVLLSYGMIAAAVAVRAAGASGRSEQVAALVRSGDEAGGRAA